MKKMGNEDYTPRYPKTRRKKTPSFKMADREILRDLLLNDPEFNELLRTIVADIVAGNQEKK